MTWRAIAGRKGYRGFSLIEIIAVVVISALVLQGLATLTGTMLRNWGEFNRRTGDLAAAFSALDVMAREINGILPMTDRSSAGSKVRFLGEPDQMVFARPAVGFDTDADLNQVAYAFEQQNGKTQIVRYSGPFVASKPLLNVEGPVRSVLAEIAGQFGFEYSGDGLTFLTQWRDQAASPAAIRISFSLSGVPGRVFRKTAVTFIDGVVACLSVSQGEECEVQKAARP
jgi:prepilin-type N-terminal cleavage/methylation domain-containing protein